MHCHPFCNQIHRFDDNHMGIHLFHGGNFQKRFQKAANFQKKYKKKYKGQTYSSRVKMNFIDVAKEETTVRGYENVDNQQKKKRPRALAEEGYINQYS